MEKVFNNKVILILGEVSNLSMGIIHFFLKEKAIVIYPAKSLRQVEMIKSFGEINTEENFITMLIDVKDFDRVTETCENITEKFGKIDIAVAIPEFSNAKKDLTDASMDEWNNMMETDMLPFFMGARIVLNMMKENPNGMFVHVSDGRFFENITSCALARVAFSTRMEMSKIFAEEAQRKDIRYYHIWAQDFSSCSGNEKPESGLPAKSPEVISREIIDLYQQETYNIEMAMQSFPKQLLQQQF